MFSHNCFGEGVLEIIQNTKRFLKPTGKIIPGSFRVCALPVIIEDNEFKYFNYDGLSTNEYYQNSLNQFGLHIKIIKAFDPHEIFYVDMNKDFKLEDSKQIKFENINGANAILIYFEIYEEDIVLSTFDVETLQYKTHWRPYVYFSNQLNGKLLNFHHGRRNFYITEESV